jgi:succinate dehydrogenase / fumarate reductase, membrane anchor subunit
LGSVTIMDGPSLRTPLSTVRYLGAARLGTEAVWRQKVTSVALIPLAFAFVYLALRLVSMDYAGVRATLGSPLALMFVLAFVIAGVVHMQIGMRSIIDDYLQGHKREWALIANTLAANALGFACVVAALRIGLS